MKAQKILLILICLSTFIQFSFGQQIEQNQPTESWLNRYGINVEPFIYFRYDRYSKEDVENFRKKLDLLNNEKFDEWEGIYTDDFPDLVGTSQFRWKADAGFASFYIYSCLPELRYINYGKVTVSSDSIQLSPEFSENSPRKSESFRYIKVKWNARYYLVEEKSLEAFAEKAAGIYVDAENTAIENSQRWRNYIVKGDLEEALTGLPEFPLKYKRLERKPIVAKIIFVGNRNISKEIFGNIYHPEGSFYTVMINVGNNKNVKAGMKFQIAETKDELFITQVNEKTSVGTIHRDVNDNKADLCRDENYNEVTCPKLRNSLTVKTLVGNFWD